MADNKQYPAPENLEQQIARARLTLDQLNLENEHQRTFFEAWRLHVEPWHEMAEHSRKMAHEFAVTTIRSLIILNGGALVAFPAFGQILGTSLIDHKGKVAISILCFAIGLGFGTATALLAYLTMDADQKGAHLWKEWRAIAITKQPDDPERRKEQAAKSSELESNAKKFANSSSGRRLWAIGLGIGSMLAFGVGSSSAAYLFLTSN